MRLVLFALAGALITATGVSLFAVMADYKMQASDIPIAAVACVFICAGLNVAGKAWEPTK